MNLGPAFKRVWTCPGRPRCPRPGWVSIVDARQRVPTQDFRSDSGNPDYNVELPYGFRYPLSEDHLVRCRIPRFTFFVSYPFLIQSLKGDKSMQVLNESVSAERCIQNRADGGRRQFLKQVCSGTAAAVASQGMLSGVSLAQNSGPAGSPLPTIQLGTYRVTRLIAGGNPIGGWSHATNNLTRHMLEYFTLVAGRLSSWRNVIGRGLTPGNSTTTRKSCQRFAPFGERRLKAPVDLPAC